MKKTVARLIGLALCLGLCACAAGTSDAKALSEAAPDQKALVKPVAPLNSAAPDDAQATLPDIPAGEYWVRVIDQDGIPVEQAFVQFCDDTACMFGYTDAEGIAIFAAEPGSYRTHVLVPPEGYAADPDEIPVEGPLTEIIIIEN